MNPTGSDPASLLAMSVVLLATALFVAGLLLQPRWQAWRRARLARQPFPQAWRRVLRKRVPLVAKLPADLQLKLKQRMQVFLAETVFIGCAGLRVNDEMRVTIAAQACLLLLGRPEAAFDRLRQVLLYPGAFIVDRVHSGAAGVQREERRVLSGESWQQGQVILSWQDVVAGAADASDGHNVVIHEFAHQLDQANGPANGAPLLGTRAQSRRWSQVMQAEFDALHARLARGQWAEPGTPEASPGLLNPYGATDPAEFFAVTSEVFFEQPQALLDQHPALYQVLSEAYGQHPASW